MRSDGSLLLEGFIRKDAIQSMCAEVTGLPSHRRLEIVEVMKRDPWVDKSLFEADRMPSDPDHPLKFKMPQDVHAVANDLVPASSMLRKVYDSQEVMDFIAAVNGKQQIYQYADEFQALNVMYEGRGSRAWHYDGDYVVT